MDDADHLVMNSTVVVRRQKNGTGSVGAAANTAAIDNKITRWMTLNTLTPICRHMGTAIKHPVPDRVKPSLVIFDIWAL